MKFLMVKLVLLSDTYLIIIEFRHLPPQILFYYNYLLIIVIQIFSEVANKSRDHVSCFPALPVVGNESFCANLPLRAPWRSVRFFCGSIKFIAQDYYEVGIA